MFQGIPSLMIAGIQSSATGSSLLTGLNVYYKLENVNDSSGNSQTLTNNNTVTFVAGKVNNGANFVAASSQSLTAADAAPFQMGTGDFTVSLWFNAATGDPNRRQMVMYGALPSGLAGYGLYRWDESLLFSISDGTHSVECDTTAYFDSTWHFLVATFSRAGNMTLYLDNTSIQSKDITAVGSVNHSTGFNMGAQFDLYYNGMLDEVGFWSRVLTGTELTALWNSGAGVTYPFS